VRDQIGFRSIETKGTDILLNGRPIFLRGICIHEEAPLRGGRAYSREDALTLLGWAKELGANFVRLAHYPHNEFIVREADRMGIMVWSEIPVYWTILWENPATFGE
jgi:beta-glucuronidase